MKKTILFTIVLGIPCVFALSGCGSSSPDTDPQAGPAAAASSSMKTKDGNDSIVAANVVTEQQDFIPPKKR